MSNSGFRHVYGPVPSRRLGRSLGVDLVPYKTCSYDCVYCQCGRTTNKTVELKEYEPLDQILAELEAALAQCAPPDYIGIAGSGEPTLHSRLGEFIAAVKRMTKVPVAVLTNGSLLWMPEVSDGLMEADLVMPSLDAGDERLFRIINRPHERISFPIMVDGLEAFTRKFRGQVWLEVFLLAGSSGTSIEASKIAEVVKRVSPSRVQLNTIHRPPAENSARPVPHPDLEELLDLFPSGTEIIAEKSKVATASPPAVREEEILALIGRRPCTAEDVALGLGIHLDDALKQLEQLTAAGKASTVVAGGRAFYSATEKRAGETTGGDE